MNWIPLNFAKDWPGKKAGEPTGTLISADRQWMIEPMGPENEYRLMGATQEVQHKTNYRSITGTLEELKNYDLSLFTTDL